MQISDPSLPFVILNNVVRIKAKSCVDVPVRFVPVLRKSFQGKLRGKVLNNTEECFMEVFLLGSSV